MKKKPFTRNAMLCKCAQCTRSRGTLTQKRWEPIWEADWKLSHAGIYVSHDSTFIEINCGAINKIYSFLVSLACTTAPIWLLYSKIVQLVSICTHLHKERMSRVHICTVCVHMYGDRKCKIDFPRPKQTYVNARKLYIIRSYVGFALRDGKSLSLFYAEIQIVHCFPFTAFLHARALSLSLPCCRVAL